MLRTGIERFVGFWVSESGYRLRIRKVRKDQAFVDFLDPRGAPIARPYMGGAPSMKMIAHYDDYNEDFRVDLWEEGKGFICIWITSTITFWTPSSAKRLKQRSVDTSGTVFWMRITHCLALWITLFEQPNNRGRELD
jgi:hypothetical protein